MNNDKIFNKLPLPIGDDVRVLENKDKFEKGNAQFSQEIYEIHDRIGFGTSGGAPPPYLCSRDLAQ
jgi:hypothetical protein